MRRAYGNADIIAQQHELKAASDATFRGKRLMDGGSQSGTCLYRSVLSIDVPNWGERMSKASFGYLSDSDEFRAAHGTRATLFLDPPSSYKVFVLHHETTEYA